MFRNTERRTKLLMRMGVFTLTLQIEGPLSIHLRRVLLLTIFRRIKPVLKVIRSTRLHHIDGYPLAWVKAEMRGVSLVQAPRLKTHDQKTGFRIRARRLDFGLTQAQLAAMSNLSRGEINAIECGRLRPRPLTLISIEHALNCYIRDICQPELVVQEETAGSVTSPDSGQRSD